MWSEVVPLEVAAEMKFYAPSPWSAIEMASVAIREYRLAQAKSGWAEFVARSGMTSREWNRRYRDKLRSHVLYQATCLACGKTFDVDALRAQGGYVKVCNIDCARVLSSRSRRVYEVDGVTMNLSGWARKRGIDKRVVHKRLSLGWPIRQALGLVARPSPTSRHKGVLWHKASKKWMAQASIGGRRQKYLGLHLTEEAARQAVEAFTASVH